MKGIAKAASLAAASCVLLASGAGVATATGHGATAKGKAVDSPGVISGNNVQVPVSVPVNLCGNSVNVIALLDPATEAECVIK